MRNTVSAELRINRGALHPLALVLAVVLLTPLWGGAALIDRWRAEDLGLNDGDNVGAWTSVSNRTVNGGTGLQPTFIRSGTPGGGPAVRFNRHFMTMANGPLSGATAFSIVITFKANAAGSADGVNWYQRSGIVDAEQGGVVNDWGTVFDDQGRVAIGMGNPDTTTYSTAPSLVDGNWHVAVFTWGGSSQSVYVDKRTPVNQNGVGTAARNTAQMAFGGISTTEGLANRRFVGDIAEIRFYNSSLSPIEASNVINELTDTHILGNLPRIYTFAANPDFIYLGGSATLTWGVSNATSIVIDNGVGAVSGSNSVAVSPTSLTTYTLWATNANGFRSAQATITVDPGIPAALALTTNTPQNTPLALTLRGTDPQGSNLTYAVVTPPAHGSLTGTPPEVTYTPALDYYGYDTFTFKVNDGMFDSAPAPVTIKVVSPPAAPTGIVPTTTSVSSLAGPGSFIAGLRAIDPNDEDTHTFNLVAGFGDNAMFTLDGSLLFASPSFAGGAGATFNVRLRATDNTGRSFEQTLVLTVVETTQTVVINEIHYNAADNTIRDEFIELFNPTDAPIDMSQWRLRGGIDFFIPAGTLLQPGAFFVVADDPATLLSRYGIVAAGQWTGGLNNEGEEVTLRDADNQVKDRVDFKSEFPWPIKANGGGASMQLVNSALDNDLGSSWRSGTPPTPGATNVVFAANAAPNIRQVNHSPNQPASTDLVTITCKVTDPEGVASVQLRYQVVTPGSFIPSTLPLTAAQLNTLNANPSLTNALNPAFEAGSNWTTIAMSDDGLNGDEVAGDSIYTVVLPPQANRTLVRYRITVTDALGLVRRAPFEDDPSLNFAYFVYDGIPAYQGFSPSALETLPVYWLITRDADVNQCAAWFNSTDQLPQDLGGRRNEGRLYFNWEGAMVYDGVVYDHVTYRLRGANGRYHSGKRSFRIRFNDGRYLEAKDQSGNRFPKKWRELTTGKGQSNRGSESFALNEVVNMFLWNKVGVPAPSTFHFHFRVVRGAQESPADPYTGDFWGLNWAQEKYDVNFLEAHDLSKGNLYKLVDNYVLGVDERRYQGAFAVTNAEDFYNIENNLTGSQTADWLQAHANYTNWYRYHAIAEAIRHYDVWPSCNKNGAWYFEPIYSPANNNYGRMWLLPYDSTDTWGPTWNGGQDVLHDGIFNDLGITGGDAGENPEMQKEYRNTVRELRDLLFQTNEISAIIDAFAGPLSTFASADIARWKAAPSPASYNSLGIPSSPGVTGGLPAYAQDMKDFMFAGGNRGWWIDRTSVGAGGWIARLDQLAADIAIPVRPTVTYTGPADYPMDSLTFQSSAFSDPQGAGTFAAMQWRIAEVLAAGTAVSNLDQIRLEWDAAWDSGEITAFNPSVKIPSFAVQGDLLYRVRVRHKDNTGRWSQWSPPFECRPSPRDVVSALRTNLVFAEIMYNPPAQGATDGDEFEFLELKNLGSIPLDLSGLFFSDGINFGFTDGTTLAPGAVFLLARNPAALATRYPGVVVNGVYSGKLNNDGEKITLSHFVAGAIISVEYSDRAPWPVTPDGFGFSLVLADPATETYRASAAPLGTPGADGAPSEIGLVIVNEVLTAASLGSHDTIELLNTAATNVNIGGWYLTDDPTYPWKYRIPDDTIIAPGDFHLVDDTQFDPTPGQGLSFGLSSLGDEVYLFSADAGFQLTGYSHGFAFGGAAVNESFGRFINSVGEEHFPPQISTTLGATNAGPRVGPVVINEIHYHPIPGLDQFVELLNLTGEAVPLYDPANLTNTWKVSGLGFTFPTNVTLAPNGLMLLVMVSPDAFRAKYGVSAEVPIFQVPGTLQNDGELIELQGPGVPTTNGTPYFSVDTVRYNDKAPWPVMADGWGAALERKVPGQYGNDPVNWLGVAPSPGRRRVEGDSPVITVPPQPLVAVEESSPALQVTVTGTEPFQYLWYFNGQAMDAPSSATLTLTNVQLSEAGDYSVLVLNGNGTVLSETARLSVLALPVITQHPASTNVLRGSNVTFRVAAAPNMGPLIYQWLFNDALISGATSNGLTLTNVQFEQAGDYRVLVTNTNGTRSSQGASLRVHQKPAIATQPASVTVAVGEPATISVEATGSEPLWYRWRRNSGLYLWPGPSALTFPNAVLTNAGAYDVVITNEASVLFGGTLVSSRAYLIVVAPPTNQTVASGATVTFRAVVSLPASSPSFTNRYWWQFNGTSLKAGTNIAGTTALPFTVDLVLTNVGLSNAGSYTLLLSNAVVVTNAGVVSTNFIGAPAAFTWTLQIASPDVDGDGIPDDWEQANGLDPQDPTDAGLDPDGDGMTNLQEYISGTDLHDGQSYLKIDSITAENGATLTFQAVSNKTYTVQYTETLDPAMWLKLTTVNARATNRVETVVDTDSAPNRFYRLVTPAVP